MATRKLTRVGLDEDKIEKLRAVGVQTVRDLFAGIASDVQVAAVLGISVSEARELMSKVASDVASRTTAWELFEVSSLL